MHVADSGDATLQWRDQYRGGVLAMREVQTMTVHMSFDESRKKSTTSAIDGMGIGMLRGYIRA